MAVETTFGKPWLVAQPELLAEMDEPQIKQSRLDQFMANFEFTFQSWELRVALGNIRPTSKDAPNINVDDDFDVLIHAGTEKVWRALNGLKEGESPNSKNIMYSANDVYRLKRLAQLPFVFTVFRENEK